MRTLIGARKRMISTASAARNAVTTAASDSTATGTLPTAAELAATSEKRRRESSLHSTQDVLFVETSTDAGNSDYLPSLRSVQTRKRQRSICEWQCMWL